MSCISGPLASNRDGIVFRGLKQRFQVIVLGQNPDLEGDE